MLNKAMFEQLTELAGLEEFQQAVPLSEAKEEQAYRQELVLRFFAQAAYSGTDTELPKEFGDYLTDWMREAASRAGVEAGLDAELFRRTFTLINRGMGDDAFRRYDGRRHLGPFSIACYEFVSSGVAANLRYWEDRPELLADRVREVWPAPEFRANSGTGVSPRRRVPRLINASRRFFSPT